LADFTVTLADFGCGLWFGASANENDTARSTTSAPRHAFRAGIPSILIIVVEILLMTMIPRTRVLRQFRWF
jgi:hypothetical protein